MWQIFYSTICHNLIPSLTIIMKDGNQYFEKKKLGPKIFIMPCVKFLINGWQSMKSTWHHGCIYNGVAY